MKINIGYLVSTLRRSGPVMQLLNLVQHLDRSQFQPIIITLSPENAESIQKDFRQLEIPVVSMNLSRIKGFFLLKKKLHAIVEEYQLHLLHSTGIRADSLLQTVPELPGIISIRNYPFHDYCMKYGRLKGLPIAWYHTSLLRDNMYNVACSEFIHKQLQQSSVTSHVIANGVNTERFFPAADAEEKKALRRELGLPENGFLWISTGSLIARKDPLTAMEAFIRFTKLNAGFAEKGAYEKSYLILVGDGPLRTEVESFCRKNSSVIYAGSSSRIREYLAAGDAFLSASFSEGLPNSVLEALSCGLPAVLSDIPPHRELPGALYFPAGDVRALTQVLDRFSRNKTSYSSVRDIIVHQFDSRAVSMQYQELYRKCLKENHEPELKKQCTYSKIERLAAAGLTRFPQIKQILKHGYVNINYFLFHSKIPAIISPSWELETCTPTQENCFFGYYDRTPVSSSGQLLYHKILPEGNVAICVDKKMMAVTGAWNLQQGALATWIGEDFFLYNSFESVSKEMQKQLNRELCCRKINTQTGEEMRLPFPVYSAVPGSTLALSLNFDRLTFLRPEYGYPTRSVNPKEFPSTEDDGVFSVNLQTGETQLLFSLAQLAQGLPDIPNEKQKINHIQLSPDAQRCIFLYRWFDNDGVKHSRLYFARLSDGYLALLADEGMVSHCNFVDETHVGGWMRLGGHDGYYCIDTQTGYYRPEGAGILTEDGHPTFCGQYLITDTYPDRSGMMKLLVYDRKDHKLIAENRLFSPIAFRGGYRCDLHPRPVLKDGKLSAIYIDSTHTGMRGVYKLIPGEEN